VASRGIEPLLKVMDPARSSPSANIELPLPAIDPQSRLVHAVVILGSLTLVRLIGLSTSVVDLFPDEAQYWSWSRDLAWGYFSKPPLLAWIIAAADQVCGSAEACIRAPAPLFYLATSLVVYAIAAALHDGRAAFWAAMLTAFGTGVVFSARIISTDVPLLLFWALALLAYVKLLERPRVSWSIVLGLALGLGCLAKYAMVYFLLGAGLAALLEPRARQLLTRRESWIALAIGAALVAPNLAWNFQNGMITFGHTRAVVNAEQTLGLHPAQALEFLAAQFGVMGPVVFAVLILALARIRSPALTAADRLMLAFAIPPLALITLAALLTKAYANWAATAAIPAIVLAAAVLTRREAWPWLRASIVIGAIAQFALLAGDAFATKISLSFLPEGQRDLYRRTLGWRAMAAEAGKLARNIGAATIAGDERNQLGALYYYLRGEPVRILAWPADGNVNFDLTRPLTEAAAQPILFVTICPAPARHLARYATAEPLGSFSAASGPSSSRTYYAFKLAEPRGPVGPLPMCS
jgi:4-amino-4-deoxy-L-arabinose transferase-like glycosyltransferase